MNRERELLKYRQQLITLYRWRIAFKDFYQKLNIDVAIRNTEMKIAYLESCR